MYSRTQDMTLILPLSDILTLLQQNKLAMYLQPTSWQLSMKRMIFHLMVKLFGSFGLDKLANQGDVLMQRVLLKGMERHIATQFPAEEQTLKQRAFRT